MSANKTETDLLAPFEIWEVPFDSQTIKFREPLSVTPQRMPREPDATGDEEYLMVLHPELAIDVFAENREELLAWVHSDIRMNWKHFVSQNDSKLDHQARVIKHAYLALAEVVDG